MSPSPLPGPVLVVDDDPEVLAAYELMFVTSGLEVRTARNAQEAMAHAQAEAIPVCLVDLHLGESDGIQLCAELRAQNPAQRCLIVTAYPAYESAVSALKLGIVDYFSKAEAPSTILAKVMDALQAAVEEERAHRLRCAAGTQLLVVCQCGAANRLAKTLESGSLAVRPCPDATHLPTGLEFRPQGALVCADCARPTPSTLLQSLVRLQPQVRPLVVGSALNDAQQLELLEAGARGFLVPSADPQVVGQALDIVLRDHYWINRRLTTLVLARLLPPREPGPALESPLSPRELEILQALTEGLSNQEIGDRLFISESTVKIHVHRIFRKIGAKSRTQALLRAMELKLF